MVFLRGYEIYLGVRWVGGGGGVEFVCVCVYVCVCVRACVRVCVCVCM